MKSILIAASFLVLVSCGKPHDHVEHNDENNGEDPNRALYDQVMSIHDEVMPKMEDVYTLKKNIADKILSTCLAREPASAINVAYARATDAP